MPADPARIAIARQLLAQLGVTLADLREDLDLRPAVPTVGEYLPQVIAAAGPGAKRTYGTYWARMAAAFGMTVIMPSPCKVDSRVASCPFIRSVPQSVADCIS